MNNKLTKRALLQVHDDLVCCTSGKCLKCSLAPLHGDACKDKLLEISRDALGTVLSIFPPDIGSKVRFINAASHEASPDYAPPAGTIGTVVRVLSAGDLIVQWPEGTTRGAGRWSCAKENIEEVC